MKRRSRRRIIFALILLPIVGVNVIAFVQAWTQTHFIANSTATASAEKLSVSQKLWVMVAGVRMPRPINRSTPADFQLPFSIRHVQSKDANLEVWSIPAVPSEKGLVLMYHAYGGDKESLLPMAVEFHHMEYAVDVVDFRGSGGSTGNRTTVGYKEAYDVAATVADARQNHLSPHEPLILFGQSMGAAAVLRAVGDLGVSADAIIIESPYDRLLSTANNRFRAMHLPAFPLAQLLIFWGGTEQGYWGFGMNPAESATRVRCPVLMFHGQLDTRVTPAQARAVFDNLAGPKQLEWYDQAGHCGFLSSDPVRWRSVVSALLAGLVHQ
jgi:alpha-beta hydrolase superfamily lysophospholipase